MPGALEGRVAVVTGAASGMGRVMARALAGAGAKIAAVDINAAGLDRLIAEPVFGNTAYTIAIDVAVREACQRAAREVVATFGRIDILINCAGISMSVAAPPNESRVKFQDSNPDGMQRILAINAGGAYLMARYCVEPMVKQGWGRIVNVTTSFDTMMAAGLCAYGAAKSALEASTVSWSKDLDGTGVTVNTLVPGGAADTGFFPDGLPKPKGLIDPQVMAAPVVWLASPASDGMTGSRFIARFWDTTLPPAEAAAKIRTPAGWPELAAGATAGRGMSTEEQMR